MALIFWDKQRGDKIGYHEQGRMIIRAYYAGELRQLHQEIAKKRRGQLNRSILLLQDNVPAHTSQVAMTADMTPSDLFLFPILIFHLQCAQNGNNKCAREAVN